MNSINVSFGNLKTRTFSSVLLVVCMILVLGMTQDFVHSSIKGYHFYWYESLLFNSFWLLFIPITLLQYHVVSSKRWDSSKQRILKISLFTLSLTIIHLLTFPLIVYSFSNLLFDDAFNYAQVLEYTVSENSYLSIAIYALISVIVFKRTEKNLVPEKVEYLQRLSLSRKTEKLIIETNEIFSIHSESPYIKLITSRGAFLEAQTLKSISEKLNPEAFIRVHKSAIVNTKEVTSYKSRLNGDYDITLTNGSIIRMSRNFSNEFKKRFF